jgi:hypothetical protein
MRTLFFGAVAFAMTLAVGSAGACPVGGDEVRRGVGVENVSLRAGELFERAQALETAAAERDRSATNLDRSAESFASRARALRNQAAFVAVVDRESVLDRAEELSTRAAVLRERASDERSRASVLRGEARQLRNQATLLVRGNGGRGWRNRNTLAPTPEPTTI